MGRGGFSWKRATGISGVKSSISKKIVVPVTKSGRQQKVGRVTSGGCWGLIAAIIMFMFLIVVIF